MIAQLEAAVENAYCVFGTYRVDKPLSVCFCSVCMNEETEKKLRTTSLRSITTDLLFEYRNSCHDRKEPKAGDELRYFLPRYFELIAQGKADEMHPEGICCVLLPLRDLNWRNAWPNAEVAAIDGFFAAIVTSWVEHMDVVRHCERVGKDYIDGSWHLGWDLSFVLDMILESGGDIDVGFAAWDEADDPAAAIHMANYCQEHREGLAEFEAFFMRPEIAKRIEAAFFKVEDERLRDILSCGLSALQAHKIQSVSA